MDMGKKIGVFTWWDNANYGGFLQALATQEYLKKLGHQPEFIRLTDKFLYYRKGRKEWLKFVLYQILFGFPLQTCLRYLNTHQIISRLLNASPFAFAHNNLKQKELARYDLLLCGSDQIWNPLYCKQGEYLLNDTPEEIPKISYASSVAVKNIPLDLQQLYKNALPKFKAISVREKAGADVLSVFFPKSIEWVVDPTLLLTAKEWKNILQIKEKKSDHIVVYLLSENVDTFLKLIPLVKHTRKKIHLYTEHSVRLKIPGGNKNWNCFIKNIKWCLFLLFSPRVKILKYASAKKFVTDICNASMVLSDSFHAMMFSVIFEKNIKIFIPPERENMKSRIKDFCEQTDGKNIVVTDFSGDVFDIPGSFSKEKMEKWKQMSSEWLKLQLEES
ncbi:MAG: polysaccharide pyruvyl transferase family protein [Lentisphaeria bacterium]|nr:polysaccharide pyruvyl transferase family protein [Lentisphaeria bacterium]